MVDFAVVRVGMSDVSLVVSSPPFALQCATCGMSLTIRPWRGDLIVYCRPCSRYSLRDVVKHIVCGLLIYRFPPCCVAQFAWDSLRGERAAVQRGSVTRKVSGSTYVPCEKCRRVVA